MNIIQATVFYVAYMFIITVCFLVLSSPFEHVVDGIETVNMPQVNTSGVGIRTAFNMAFALAGLIPSVFFIVWVFHREPDWSYRRY